MSIDRQSLQISKIRRDGGTQPRTALDVDTVRNYAEAYSRGEELPPVEAFYDGSHYWLADGFHRCQGALDAGQDEIDANIRQGTQRDAVLYSVGANATHGLPRSDEDKRRAVMRLLEDEEWSTWSDRKIAAVTRTSHPFVGKLRHDVFGDDALRERTVERDGQQYTMSTDGINADRDIEMITLANDYADLIPSLLPPDGLLYDELREQLAVDANDSMQIRAYRRALDTLFGQQKIVKDGARYKVTEGDPDTASGPRTLTIGALVVRIFEDSDVPGMRSRIQVNTVDGRCLSVSYRKGNNYRASGWAISNNHTVAMAAEAPTRLEAIREVNLQLRERLEFNGSPYTFGEGARDREAAPVYFPQDYDPDTAGDNDPTPDSVRTARDELNAKFDKGAITLLNRTDDGAWHRAIEIARRLVAAGAWDGNVPIMFDAYELHDQLFGVHPADPFDPSVKFFSLQEIPPAVSNADIRTTPSGIRIQLFPDASGGWTALLDTRDGARYTTYSDSPPPSTRRDAVRSVIAQYRASLTLIDHIDPLTAEVTQRPAVSTSDPEQLADPDAETRAWFRKQLRESPRHYNILSRIARTDGINMKAFLHVARAMIDDNEVELDGMIYKLTGDTREQPALPDELSADEKAAIRDALIAAVRDEALTSTQINNAIHAATGKKLDILYLINWLDMLARDEKLLKTAKNGDMPRYQLNPNPPSDAEIQASRQAADVATRLGIVRQAIADRLPNEQISVTWLKRAAPLAVANAAEAGELLTLLVQAGELRAVEHDHSYEIVTVESAESTEPGQDGEAAVERADEPRGRDELPPAAGTSPAPQVDEHAQQHSTALLHRAQFEKALFALDDAFKDVRVIRSIQTWHTLDEQQIEKTRQAIAMARTWLFDLDGFLEDFDDALAEIAETGEPYLERVEAKPVEDEVEVQA